MVSFSRETGLVVACAALFAPAAIGQTVEFAVVGKAKFNVQTAATNVSLLPAEQLPFGFDVNISGVDIHLLDAPRIAGPISNPEPGHNGGVLGYNSDDGEWRYGSPNSNGWGTETQVELDSLFGSGPYTLTINGTDIPLNLTDADFPPAPLLTLAGGAWDNGVYVIEPDQELVITTSQFPAYGTHVLDGIWVEIWGFEFGQGVDQLSTDTPDNSLSMIVAAGSLTAGEYYTIESGFLTSVDVATSIPEFPGAIMAAFYEQSTAITVMVPLSEPCLSDLAEPYGLLDLADITAFVTAFSTGDLLADLAEPYGLLDLADITAFVTAFVAGCP